MSSEDILRDFNWHSSIGIDYALEDNKRFVTRMPNTRQARAMFEASGNDLLIHKTTRCLWRISDGKDAIEPVFSNDILTEEDIQDTMEETT